MAFRSKGDFAAISTRGDFMSLRVLWLVNVPLPAVSRRLKLKPKGSGHWLQTLSQAIAANPSIGSLTIAHASHTYSQTDSFEEDGIAYFTIPASINEIAGKKWHRLILRLANLVETVRPDVVDVHGTEYSYGRITRYIDEPVLITVQGLMAQSREHPHGDLSLSQVLTRQTRTLKDLPAAYLTLRANSIGRVREQNEVEIFKENTHFIGRTDWDEAMTRRLSPFLKRYTRAWRIERAGFYNAEWRGPSDGSMRLFSCARCNPQKGQHNLIELLHSLKDEFPQLSLGLTVDPSQPGWPSYLLRLAKKLGVSDRVDFLGYLSEEGIIDQLKNCSIFVHPTYQDNGPNSVAEAMLVGTPIVAANIAGVSSMLTDRISGLLYPPGDQQALSSCVRTLLKDQTLAKGLAYEARRIAHIRHSPKAVVDATLEAYLAARYDKLAVE
jgi:glycosyltransferase involved in cell wall biosynthesis